MTSRSPTIAPPADWAHQTYEGMVYDLGQPFVRKSLPAGFGRMKAKNCYKNVITCALRGSQYRYVEGYAAGVISTEHAFVLDTADGKIFDPTWPRNNGHNTYFGIVFPTVWVRDYFCSTGYYGLLVNDWMFENTLFRNGRSLWEASDGNDS